jgi:hypothetical protein
MHIARSPRPRRRRARRSSLAVLPVLTLVLMAATGCQPLGPVEKVAVDAVRLPETSDPFVVHHDGRYYVYGSDNHLRAPVTVLTDIDRPYTLWEKNSLTVEGMPQKPAWAARERQLWAPTVGRFGDRWIMYFAADRISPPDPANPQCVGRAIASSPAGPFVPEPQPITCGINWAHGALDPDVFTDADGRRWLYVAFGNTMNPIHVFPLDAWGNISGPAAAVLGRQHPWEYHFIENPAMVYDRSRGSYLLAYSAGRWYEAGYSTGIARCATPTGPCTSDPTGPWIQSSNGRSGPGGLSFFEDRDGAQRAIYSTFQAGWETTNGGRSASIEYLKVQPAVTLTVVK